MLRVRGLSKRIDHVVVLRNINLEVGSGEVVCLYGPNGSGKSTLMRILAGLDRPDCGKIILMERDITEESAWDRVASGIAYAFQIPRPFKSLKFVENLALPAMVRMDREQAFRLAEGVAERYGVEHLLEMRADRLSQGELKILELLRAYMTGARLLLLDEPFASLDTDNARYLREKLVEMREEGMAMLITSHRRRILEGIADRFVRLEGGVVSADR
ncbi:ATP-binding cassette domain-containing protein [Geoglobus ahangari]